MLLKQNLLIAILLFLSSSLSWSQESVSGEILIKLKPTVSFPNTKGYVKSAHASGALSQKKSWTMLNIHQVKIGAGLDTAMVIAKVLADPDVEYAEPNYIVKATQLGSFGLLGSSGFSQCSAPIDVDEAWSILTPDLPHSIIAIIDTGVDTNHEVFTGAQALWTNPNEIASNGIDDDNNGYIDDVYGWNFVAKNNQPMDDNGHGTHVAGIALGVTQDIFASSLATAKVQIMSLKFLDSEGSGSVSDAIDAIVYAINNGAHVLNNSWGGSGLSQALLDAVKKSHSAGRSFIAAAGNETNDNDANPTYPASYAVDNIIAVTATTDSDGLASFSNYGAVSVHVGSPGVGINSTLPSNSYGKLSGTSMATPFVAGTIALMIREKSFIDGVQAKSLLLGSVEKISSLTGKASTEARLNVYNAVVAAQNATETNSTSLSSGSDSNLQGASSGGGCGLVRNTSKDSGGGGSAAACLLLLLPFFTYLFLRKTDGRYCI